MLTHSQVEIYISHLFSYLTVIYPPQTMKPTEFILCVFLQRDNEAHIFGLEWKKLCLFFVGMNDNNYGDPLTFHLEHCADRLK